MTKARPLAVIGAATMGAGIAYLAVAAGLDVTLHDADSATRANAAARSADMFDEPFEWEDRQVASAGPKPFASGADIAKRADRAAQAAPRDGGTVDP